MFRGVLLWVTGSCSNWWLAQQPDFIQPTSALPNPLLFALFWIIWELGGVRHCQDGREPPNELQNISSESYGWLRPYFIQSMIPMHRHPLLSVWYKLFFCLSWMYTRTGYSEVLLLRGAWGHLIELPGLKIPGSDVLPHHWAHRAGEDETSLLLLCVTKVELATSGLTCMGIIWFNLATLQNFPNVIKPNKSNPDSETNNFFGFGYSKRQMYPRFIDVSFPM